MNWYLEVLRKYAQFSGRARRKEYWLFTLFNGLIVVALMLIGMTTGRVGNVPMVLYVLAVLIPSFAVRIRRLHDTDHSGWWILIGLVPVIGGIILLVFYVTEGDRKENRYGPDPKAAV